MTVEVDPATLSERDIIAAITEHCRKMGSYSYYIADEIARWQANPGCIVVFRDRDDSALRAYCRGSGTP